MTPPERSGPPAMVAQAPNPPRPPLAVLSPGRGELGALWAALLLALCVYGVQAFALGRPFVDDAFISLRYARNLVEGHGLVFNPGERVEGYTNFLWTALLSIPFAAGWDPLVFLHALGLFSGVLLLTGAAWLARELVPGRAHAAGVAALLTAGMPFLVAESVMGLETAFFAGLAGLGLAAYLGRTQRPVASALLLAAAALTRPEGLLVCGWVGLHDLVRSAREPARRRAFLVRWSLAGGIVASHVLLRFLYYGDVVPNTFHAKVGGGWASVARGLEHGGSFAVAVWPLLLLAVLALVSRAARERAVRSRLLLVFTLAAVYAAYSIYVGGDFKRTYRFFALPALILASLAGVGIVGLTDRLGRWRHIGALGVSLLVVFLLWFGGGPARRFSAQRTSLYPHHLAVGAWLRDNFPPDTLLAAVNVGAVPYESRLAAIDMVGLCDRHIARQVMPDMGQGVAGHEKADASYVLERRPDVVLFQSARLSPQPLRLEDMRYRTQWQAERDLWGHPRFQREYRLRTVPLGAGYFNFFERID